MARLSAGAARLLREVHPHVHALTDITGFGLAGHALKMALGSGVRMRFDAGTLPLLEYALSELYERRDGGRLTLEAYRQSGGISGALARRLRPAMHAGCFHRRGRTVRADRGAWPAGEAGGLPPGDEVATGRPGRGQRLLGPVPQARPR